MRASIDGNKFTVSVTFTRFKAAMIMVFVGASVWVPYHLIQDANKKIYMLTKTKTEIVAPSVKLDIKEPIISPYALSTDAKKILYEWLLYGLNNGHDEMLKKYIEKTENKNDYKPFLYLIESEWRLGHWDSVKLP